MQVAQGNGLGADMPTAKGIVGITFYGHDFLAPGFDHKAADGLAEMTRAIVGFGHANPVIQ